MKIIFVLSVTLLLTSCWNKEESQTSSKAKESISGSALFEKNCAVCHGKAAAGLTKNWKKPLADGSYPAPPLNGKAHAWHHSPKVLLKSINEGGEKIGGQMPAFKDKLTQAEKQAILDYLFSLWPPNIQNKYNARFKK